MPISSASPYPTAGGNSAPMLMGALNIPQVNNVSQNPAPDWQTSPYASIYGTLTQGAPQSLTNMIGPLLNQIFGNQANLLQPLFQQQTNANVASAQSDAMTRGLTGSTIEAANMTGARTTGDQAYNQYISGQMNNLVPSLMQSGMFDINNSSNYYDKLAQFIGQANSQNIQQQQFQDMLAANVNMADSANKAGMWSAGISALGNMAGGAMKASDIRLKQYLKHEGIYNGMNVYSFEYKQDTQFDLPKGRRHGLLGHEVYDQRPDCVALKDGYFFVDYGKLLAESKVENKEDKYHA